MPITHSIRKTLKAALDGTKRRGKPHVLILNDPADQENWGSQGLSVALDDILRERLPEIGFDRFYSLDMLHSVDAKGQELADVPEVSDGFEMCANRWEKGLGGVHANQFLEQARRADLVLFNAEGSMYRNNQSARKAMFMCWYAKTRLGKPVVVLNGMLHLTDVEAVLPPIVQRVYPLLDAVSVRDPLSLANAKQYLPDVPVELIPDSVFYYADNGAAEGWMTQYSPFLAEPYFCLNGGQLRYLQPREIREAPLCRLIQALKEIVPQCVIMVKDQEDQYLRDIAEVTGSHLFSGEKTFQELVGALAHARFQMTGRYHLTIFGAMVGCPTLGMQSTSHKVQGVVRLLECGLPQPFNSTDVLRNIDHITGEARQLLEKGESLRKILRARAQELGNQTRRLAEIVAQVTRQPHDP